MKNVLKAVKEQMDKLGINYEYKEMTASPVKYPYWVGSYFESGADNEDGMTRPSFTLSGFFRGALLEMEEEKSRICDRFRNGVFINGDGFTVSITTGSVRDIETEGDLRRCEIDLEMMYWRS